MKESKFVAKNKDKWEEFERMLAKKNNNPDQLSDLFIEINEDTSYANTFFGNRVISRYLNKLSVKLYAKVFSRIKRRNGFWFFWREELPYVAHKCRKEIYLCSLFLISCILLGVLSSIVEPEFCRQILGDHYVNMTEEFIASGDPMQVYKKSRGSDMFLRISLNNVRVSLITFASGIIGGIGSLIVIAHNGVMVGAFQFFFIERGLFLESFLTIWMHGAIEISLIGIEGAAGLVIGKGLILPGNLPRLTSLKRSAKRGVKLLLGTLPLIVLAAFIESFVTRFTEIPDLLRAVFIICSFALVAFLYFINPKRVAKRGFHPEVLESDEVKTGHLAKPKENRSKVINNKDIFTHTIAAFTKNFNKARTFTFVLCLLATGYVSYQYWFEDSHVSFFDQRLGSGFFYLIGSKFMPPFDYDADPIVLVINTIMIIGAALVANKILGKGLVPSTSSLLFLVLYGTGLSFFIPYNLLTGIICFLTAPIFLTASALQLQYDMGIGKSLNKALAYLKVSYMKQLLLTFVFSALFFMLLGLYVSPLPSSIIHFISPYFFTNTKYMFSFQQTILTILFYTTGIAYLCCLYLSAHFSIKACEEVSTAQKLKENIQEL